MFYRSLGRCGTRVSVFGLGGWLSYGESGADPQTVRTILTTAFDAGINFFDIADIYSKGEAERAMGRVLADFPRHELVVSSKVFFPMSDEVNDRGLSRKHIFESVHGSLQRIGTDYLDIYFCHRFDESTPVEETAQAMDDLVRQGKILYWGTSEWTGAQLHQVHRICDKRNLHPPQVEQPQLSLIARRKFEQDVRPVALEYGMGMVVWSPLGMGILTGKYDKGLSPGSRMAREQWLCKGRYTEQNLERVRRFKVFADELGCSRAQLALAWARDQAGVSSVILGAPRPEQLQDNLGALTLAIDEDLKQNLDNLFPTAGAEEGEE
ncbi:MAG: aldo/keto reductase family protein [Phycisphaerae bacterium]|nr:aldo/keto reductase family protein [Phycisphaerae bacterium]